LEILRHQNKAAEQEDTKHEQHQTCACEIEVLEHSHINNRRLLKPLPHNQGNKAYRRNYDQTGDEARSEPIVFLTFVEEDLQSAHADREKSKPNIVQFDSDAFQSLQIRRVLDEAPHEKPGHHPDRKIDKEN